MKGLRENKGAAAVEFAALFLLLLIIVFGIIEFGFIWLQSHYIANGAREGARVAARVAEPKSTGKPKVETAVKEYLKGIYAAAKVDGPGGCCSCGDFIEVAIADEVIAAGLPAGENPAAVKVSVKVRTSEVWNPILWDLLKLLPGSSASGDLSTIGEFAIFALEP